MNDFFENGIIPEIDDKIINYLNLIGESGLSSIYMRNLYFCRNRREQDKAVAIFLIIMANIYLLTCRKILKIMC